MPLRTRGSAALEKAQRRLALLKSVDESLDLGHGLTIAAYTQLIETARARLESYNTLLSAVKESREAVIQMDATLSAMSERMLLGVATRYGKQSVEYAKAGGSISRRKQVSSASTAPMADGLNSALSTTPPVITGNGVSLKS